MNREITETSGLDTSAAGGAGTADYEAASARATGKSRDAMIAIYRRERTVSDWIAVEIIERRANGDAVLRELGKLWPGVWIARRWQVATGDDA